jgi:hypothetical protein
MVNREKRSNHSSESEWLETDHPPRNAGKQLSQHCFPHFIGNFEIAATVSLFGGAAAFGTTMADIAKFRYSGPRKDL